MKKKSKKIALVLSGGGARGIAHIGVVDELIERGYEITAIAGTSMGSLVAGVFAMGKLKEFEEWIVKLDKKGIFHLVDFTLSTQGIIKGDRVLNKIKEIVGEGKIEDLPISYAAVATDIKNKTEVVFKEGSLFDAIRASISIPTVFTPVSLDNKLLVDGGLLNNLPNNHVDQSKSDYLFSVNVNANIPVLKLEKNKEEKETEENRYLTRMKDFLEHMNIFSNEKHEEHFGYFNLINRTISIMIDNNAQYNLKNFPPDALFEISRDTADTYDFFMAKTLVETGREVAKKVLDEFEAKH